MRIFSQFCDAKTHEGHEVQQRVTQKERTSITIADSTDNGSSRPLFFRFPLHKCVKILFHHLVNTIGLIHVDECVLVVFRLDCISLAMTVNDGYRRFRV